MRSGSLFIKNLSLKNFRNYVSAEIEFAKNINIIVGNNAQGKQIGSGVYFIRMQSVGYEKIQKVIMLK